MPCNALIALALVQACTLNKRDNLFLFITLSSVWWKVKKVKQYCFIIIYFIYYNFTDATQDSGCADCYTIEVYTLWHHLRLNST